MIHRVSAKTNIIIQHSASMHTTPSSKRKQMVYDEPRMSPSHLQQTVLLTRQQIRCTEATVSFLRTRVRELQEQQEALEQKHKTLEQKHKTLEQKNKTLEQKNNALQDTVTKLVFTLIGGPVNTEDLDTDHQVHTHNN